MFRTIIILATMLLSSACTEEIQWQDYNTTNIKQLASEGKTVFVQYTADWCVTCLAQEENILNSQEVISAFKDNNVITIKADWTDYSEKIDEDIKIHGQVGLPMYILFSRKNGFKAQLLPDKIKQKDVINNI